MNDFEYLYMIRQNSEYAYGRMRSRYEALMWKLSFQNFYIQKPEGIQVNDLYQTASRSNNMRPLPIFPFPSVDLQNPTLP